MLFKSRDDYMVKVDGAEIDTVIIAVCLLLPRGNWENACRSSDCPKAMICCWCPKTPVVVSDMQSAKRNLPL